MVNKEISQLYHLLFIVKKWSPLEQDLCVQTADLGFLTCSETSFVIVLDCDFYLP